MKNKKRILSISLFVLALAFVFIGVYAIKSQVLNTVGTVGFTTHDCEVSVYGEFQNVATSKNSGTLETVTFYSEETPYDVSENGMLVFNETNLKDSQNNAVSAVYFCTIADEVPTITFLLSNIAYENAFVTIARHTSGYLDADSKTLLYSTVISTINLISCSL